jgi:hypothetical protein
MSFNCDHSGNEENSEELKKDLLRYKNLHERLNEGGEIEFDIELPIPIVTDPNLLVVWDDDSCSTTEEEPKIPLNASQELEVSSKEKQQRIFWGVSTLYKGERLGFVWFGDDYDACLESFKKLKSEPEKDLVCLNMVKTDDDKEFEETTRKRFIANCRHIRDYDDKATTNGCSVLVDSTGKKPKMPILEFINKDNL